ncbi:MAG: FAD-dependent oxidoreductase [Candidatus Omnitrophota bacterium]|nr:FAD-dependent oxidoreductase [Candidatus Omnitrophota bacterium]
MHRKRIVILGAGLAGLSAGWHLQRKGIEPVLLEKEAQVGGLCRTKNVGAFHFDCDGHLLHFKRRDTFGLVKDLLAGNLKKHKRSAWVYACGRYIPYPFQANLHQLPLPVVKECLLGLARAAQDGFHQEGNFRDWIYHHFGKGIARHFMVPYNTKFWTLPPERLSCEWLDGFVPLPTLSQMIAGSVEDAPQEFGYNSTFWYPEKGGINQLALALAAGLKNIYTNSEVTEIDLRAKKVRISGGESENYDYLISTLPLPELPRLVKNMPRKMRDLFAKLNWNSILNVNLGLDKRDGASRHWAYFPQREHCFFRAGFYHNFSPGCAPPGRGALYAEISYPREETPQKGNILARLEADLKNTGLLNGSRIIASDINEIKYGYPIYDLNYSRVREKIIRYLRQGQVIPCGRYGSWRYFSMEDSILDGKRVAGLF